MLLKGLIFDFDGLILDTEMPKYQAWKEIFQDFGLQLVLDDYAKCIGSSNQVFDPLDVLTNSLKHSVNTREIHCHYQQRELELLEKESVLPGIRELIIEAKNSNLALAIASSSDRSWVVNHLSRLGLLQYFDVVLTEDDVQEVKPHPELFSSALACLHLRPDQVMALEDSPNGMIAAKAAGLFVIGVPNAITSQLDISISDHMYSSLQNVHLQDLNHIFNLSGIHHE